MKNSVKRLVLAMGAGILMMCNAQASIITVNSGVSTVKFLDSGNSNSDFSSTLTAANYTSAQTGSTAASISNLASSWITTSSFDSGATTALTASVGSAVTSTANWIGTSASCGAATCDSALFAVSFVLPSVSSATISISFAADDQLGGFNGLSDANTAFAINGTTLGGAMAEGIGGPGSLTTVTYTLPTASLVAGTNWLYIDNVNFGGSSGLIFTAAVNYTALAPEPGSILLFASGLAGLLVMSRKRLA